MTTRVTGTATHMRPLIASDLPSIAAVHCEAFPGSVLTALGVEAVRRYYEWQLVGPHDIVALGSFAGAELAAFAIGGVFRSSLGGFVRRNRAYLALRVTTRPWLAAGPVFRSRLATGMRVGFTRQRARARPAAPAGTPVPAGRSFGVLAIATHPAHRRAGHGARLMQHLEDAAIAREFTAMHLTVSPDNDGAVRFYKDLGWYPVPDGARWDGLMRKELTYA